MDLFLHSFSRLVFVEQPGDSDSKESACSAVDPGSIPGSGRSLEKEMAPHFSILAVEFHEQRSLVDYSLWGHKESDTTE